MIFSLVLITTLKLDFNLPGDNKCETGVCGIDELQQKIRNNATIQIVNKELNAEQSKRILRLIEIQNRCCFTFIGAPTKINFVNNPISLNNSTCEFININFVFDGILFKTHNSKLIISNSSLFSNNKNNYAIDVRNSQVLVNETNIKNFLTIFNSKNSSLNLKNCEISDVAESVIVNKVENSTLIIEKTNFLNIKASNFFSLSNSISIIESINVTHSKFDSLFSLTNTSIEIASSIFSNTEGNIINGRNRSEVLLDECSILHHQKVELFVIESNSSITITESVFKNIYSTTIVKANDSNVELNKVVLKCLKVQSGININKGKMSANAVQCSNISANIFIKTCFCDSVLISKSEFTRFYSNSVFNRSIIKAINVKYISLDNNKFRANVIPPIDLDSSEGKISNTQFYLNIIIPSKQSNNSIIRFYKSKYFHVEHNKFLNNTAPNGCLFMNYCNIEILDNIFIGNNAFSGSVVNMLNSKAKIQDFVMKENLDVENAYLKLSMSSLNLLNGEINNFETSMLVKDKSNATLDRVLIYDSKDYPVRVTNMSSMVLKSVKSHKSFEKSIYFESDSNITLKNAEFGCSTRCVRMNGFPGIIEIKTGMKTGKNVIVLLLLLVTISIVLFVLCRKKYFRKLPSFLAKYSKKKGAYKL